MSAPEEQSAAEGEWCVYCDEQDEELHECSRCPAWLHHDCMAQRYPDVTEAMTELELLCPACVCDMQEAGERVSERYLCSVDDTYVSLSA